MSQKKKSFQDAAKEIDAGLGGLFGALSEAIGEMASRLEDGHSGAVERDLTFDTAKGPVRAQAGVRLRMGGLDVGGSDAASRPRPVNPNRTGAKPPAEPAKARVLAYDLFEDDDAWVLTADLPGVARKDVHLSADGPVLTIRTSGARIYEGQADLDVGFDLDAVQSTLRNGILTLRIPKGGAA